MGDPNDPNAQQQDPNEGQLPNAQAGNEEGAGRETVDSPTEFVEVKGVKIPAQEFEQLAREKFKDRFEAFDNREKWQAENTRKAQEIAEIKREAELFRQMRQQDPSFGERARPRNEFEAAKIQYVREKQKMFPDVDPRFFEANFDDLWQLSGKRAQETITPLLQQQSEAWEKQFLAEHPVIQRGSDKYYEMAELVGKGYDPEHAYRVVYQDELSKQMTDEAIKRRDEEAKKKLLNSRQTNAQSGARAVGRGDEAFERAWAKHGD